VLLGAGANAPSWIQIKKRRENPPELSKPVKVKANSFKFLSTNIDAKQQFELLCRELLKNEEI
jgi:hypothetical protein